MNEAGERQPRLPPATDWRTTDADERLKRRLRARQEKPRVAKLDPAAHPIFANFEVCSPSGQRYRVEVRDLAGRGHACTCTDFRINGLGTCKHVEAVLLGLEESEPLAWATALAEGSPLADLAPDEAAGTLRLERNLARLPARLRALFREDGGLRSDLPLGDAVARLGAPGSPVRISQEVAPWLEQRRRERERRERRRDYETGVATGRHPTQETRVPLHPYQREGMLHLAFNERALLADELGLDRTLQAVAACALLARLGHARRVLVVTPRLLRGEWAEEIGRATTLAARLIEGTRSVRLAAYAETRPPCFTLVTYEQVVADSLEINERLRPDVVVLDEAQRIRDWSSRTALMVKRLKSRYAFVLTGAPAEGRLDELRSIVDFLDPAALGPLFRFNREHVVLDQRGRPTGYKNLDRFYARVAPLILRRRRSEVETQLPARANRVRLIPLNAIQRRLYAEREAQAARLALAGRRRALAPVEQGRLMALIGELRKICNEPSLVRGGAGAESCKTAEALRLLDEALAFAGAKAAVFCEWDRALEPLREHALKRGWGVAWCGAEVSAAGRSAAATAFRLDSGCRLYLATDRAAAGPDLRSADLVVHLDVPWAANRMERRVEGAWRGARDKPLTVFVLAAADTLEQGLMAVAPSMAAADSLLTGRGANGGGAYRGGAALARRAADALAAGGCRALLAEAEVADPALAFAADARARLGGTLLRCEEVRPLPASGGVPRGPGFVPAPTAPAVLLAVVEDEAETARSLLEPLLVARWPERGQRPDLQVLERRAWEALRRLAEGGLVTIHPGERRDLLGGGGEGGSAPLVS